MANKLCPCCGRRCYLDEVKCERGREYLQTGVIPPRKPKPGHGTDGNKPNPHRQYMKLTVEEKLVVTVKDLVEMMNNLPQEINETQVFDCLRDDDKQEVLMFMEKIKHTLRHKTSK